MGTIDESFKRPGAVPFKWEIQPGIPKAQTKCGTNRARTISPPPAGVSYYPADANTLFVTSPSPSNRSQRLTSPTPSDRRHIRGQLRRPSGSSSPQIVRSPGCFPIPALSRKGSRKRTYVIKSDDNDEAYNTAISDLQTLARWSMSPRKSLSPFQDNDSPRSLSSLSTSSRAKDELEWAAYGLF